jgi:Tol biopolymer transport system component
MIGPATGAGGWEVYLRDSLTAMPRNITNSGDEVYANPLWSPDGTRLAYQDACEGTTYVYEVATGGTTLVRVKGLVQSWSPDGKYLLYDSSQQILLDGRFLGNCVS